MPITGGESPMAPSPDSELPDRWWRDRATLEREVRSHGGFKSASEAHPGVSDRTLQTWWGKHGLPPFERPRSSFMHSGRDKEPTGGSTDLEAELLGLMKKGGDRMSVEELADSCNCAPRFVRSALEALGVKGYRIESAQENGEVVLHRIPPPSDNVHPALFAGERVRVGIISDTHLGSKEEALDELNLAYDICVEEGIEQVWHPGDISCGVEVFGRKQHTEAKVHTLDDAVQYVVDHYPTRPGIVTRLVGGNHDLEGLAGRSGMDMAVAVANQRDDIEYLGPFEAWLETRPDTGRWIQILHPKGGMSYSWSYKAQKMVDAYPGGRKPALLVLGHWHVKGNIRARDVEVLWSGCFEWQSSFMSRLGLQPAVGFHIVEMTIADDGSIVRFRPEWFGLFPGRRVKHINES